MPPFGQCGVEPRYGLYCKVQFLGGAVPFPAPSGGQLQVLSAAKWTTQSPGSTWAKVRTQTAMPEPRK